jgi:hypothetical protein
LCVMLPRATNVRHFDAVQWSLLGFMGVIGLFVVVFMWTLQDGPDYREAAQLEFALRYEDMVDTFHHMDARGAGTEVIEEYLDELMKPEHAVRRMCMWASEPDWPGEDSIVAEMIARTTEEHVLEITPEMIAEFDAQDH